MVIVLMTNSVLYESFDDHRSFFTIDIFMNKPFFPKCMVYPFRHQLQSDRITRVSPLLKGELYHVLPAPCGKGNNATNTLPIMRCSFLIHIAVPSLTKYIINRAIPGTVI